MADTKADTLQADVWVLPARTRLHAAIGQGDKAPHIVSTPGARNTTGALWLPVELAQAVSFTGAQV